VISQEPPPEPALLPTDWDTIRFMQMFGGREDVRLRAAMVFSLQGA